MSLPTHLVDDLTGVRVGDRVEVTGAEAHHAVVVRRLQVGEAVLITDGRGRSVVGEVAEATKRALVVAVSEAFEIARPRPAITVVQALPKGDRGELAVELATEIGADRIVPWSAERSVAVWRGERAVKGHRRWTAAAREAAKQSRRVWHPTVDPLTDTPAVAALIADADLAVVLHEDAASALPRLGADVGSVVVVVGPEGGLIDAEVAAFEAAGGVAVRLGAEVLRTSTAGLAACAALLAGTARWH